MSRIEYEHQRVSQSDTARRKREFPEPTRVNVRMPDGMTYPGYVESHSQPFARVAVFYHGEWRKPQFSWETIRSAVNDDRTLIA